MSLEALQQRVRKFAQDRDWEQFHTPKNLAMALGGECGELLAELQWLSDEQAAEVMQTDFSAQAVSHEIADVAIYLLRLSDVLQIDLGKVILDKLRLNESRYPIPRAYGNARKYDAASDGMEGQ